MKKIAGIFIALCLMFVSFPICASASVAEIYNGQYQASGADGLREEVPDETLDYMSDAGFGNPDNTLGDGFDTEKIISVIKEMTDGSVAAPFACCCSALVISLLCSMCAGTWKSTAPAVNTVGGLLVCLSSALPLVEFIAQAGETVEKSCAFTAAFVPIYSAIMAVAGQPVTAAGYSGFALVLNDVCVMSVGGVVFPLLRIFLAMSIVASVGNDGALSKVSELAGKSAKWIFGLSAALLAGISALSSVTAAATDHVTYKAARYVLSSTLPIVGGSVSDAAAVVQGSVGVLRMSVGSFGIIAIAFIFLPQIIKACVWLVFTNVSVLLAELLGAKNIVSLYKSMSAVLSMILSLLVFTAFLMIISAAMTLGQVTL
ncbi:MAG: hypothetical protein IJP10_03735 [Clostridia bacterium]|nr:hypothetical protein [Clostridia bacterium]